MGCSCWPSPALTTTQSVQRVSACGAPAERCRRTATSTFIASMLRAVSLSVSPFETLEPPAENESVSAVSRFSASSNESRVRVEFSKNRLQTVTPRRLGTRLMGRSRTSRKARAVWRTRRTSAAGIPASPSRWRPLRRVAGGSSGSVMEGGWVCVS